MELTGRSSTCRLEAFAKRAIKPPPSVKNFQNCTISHGRFPSKEEAGGGFSALISDFRQKNGSGGPGWFLLQWEKQVPGSTRTEKRERGAGL